MSIIGRDDQGLALWRAAGLARSLPPTIKSNKKCLEAAKIAKLADYFW